MSENQWDATLYQSNHAFVWQYGEGLIDFLSPKKGERILDLGCGTGQLTQKIAETGAEVIGIDSANAMIEQAQNNYPNLQFAVADATTFKFEQPFDAVFSNAVLHWIKEPEQVIKCVYQSLLPGGRFVAEFGGKGNVRAIVDALNSAIEAIGFVPQQEMNPWYFPSIGEYASLLEKQGLSVAYATLFDRLTTLEGESEGMKNWIKMFGNSFLSDIPSAQQVDVFREVEHQLQPKLYRDGRWFADYKRIRVIAMKE